MSREKEYEVRITLPLTEKLRDAADEVLQPKEARVELIRKAIVAEVRRRRRKASK